MVKTKAQLLASGLANPIQSELLVSLSKVKTPTELAMLRRIEKAVANRSTFEMLKSPHSSHVNLRRVESWLLGNRSFARFLATLNVDPEWMLNRERVHGGSRRADLKGIMKLRLLHRFVTGETKQMNRTDVALFALTIIAANKGVGFVSNAQLELILLNEVPANLPPEVQTAIEAYKAQWFTAQDARSEACRFRTTYENLGCFEFGNEDEEDDNRQGVLVNMDSPIIKHLAQAWNL